MTSYLDALDLSTATVILADVSLSIERARLGLHLYLARIIDEIDDALSDGDAGAAADHIKSYLCRASCGEYLPQATGCEMLAAFVDLCELNTPLFVLPFMSGAIEKSRPPAYDYDDRGFALWVHKLASRYGWTRHYILNELYPEEIACYLQEILVSEYDEEDRVRVLSKMAYRLDKASSTLHFRPLPRPNWMIGPKGGPRKMRVNKAFLPMADEIVNLSNLKPKRKGGNASS